MLLKFKWYLILGVLIIGLGVGLYWSLSALFTARSALANTQAQVATLNEQLRKARANAADAQASTVASGVIRGELDHVLSKEREWGDSPVPGPVVDGLCKHLTCSSPTGQVPTPGDSTGNK